MFIDNFTFRDVKVGENITEVFVTDQQGTKIKAYIVTEKWEDICKHITGFPPIVGDSVDNHETNWEGLETFVKDAALKGKDYNSAPYSSFLLGKLLRKIRKEKNE